MCQFFLKKSDSLTDIYYFTALAKWNEGKVKRHKRYIKALETTGVKIIYGNFKTVTRKCRNCFKEYKTFEEKETDVNVGLHLLNSAYQDQFDKFFLLTADSDLIPAIKMIAEYFPNKESHIILPINAISKDLKNNSDNISQIKKKHLKSSLFPNTIHLENGTISKPEKW